MISKVVRILPNGNLILRSETYTSIVELIGGYEVSVGDKIKGNISSLGGETLFNLTQNEEMDVCIQDHI